MRVAQYVDCDQLVNHKTSASRSHTPFKKKKKKKKDLN